MRGKLLGLLVVCRVSAAFVVGTFLLAGCASSNFVGRHNAEVQAISLRANPNGDVRVGLNVLRLQGWVAAAKADPWGATVAAVEDAVVVGAIAAAATGNLSLGGKDGNDGEQPAEPPTIINNGGIVQTGDGNSGTVGKGDEGPAAGGIGAE